MSFFDIVVPTQDTVRYNAVLEALVAISRPIFLTGVTGTGKTIVIQVCFTVGHVFHAPARQGVT